MVNSYENLTFLTSVNDLIEIIVSYRVVKPVESAVLKQTLSFKIVDTQVSVVSAKDWFLALEDAILEPKTNLLGKNVKVISLQMTNQTTDVFYKMPFTQVFGRAESNSDSTNVLVFELLADSSAESLRYNFRAPSNLFTKRPIPPENLPKIFAFESIFVKSINIFDESVTLSYEHKTKKQIIAANLKYSSVKRPKNPILKPKTARKPVSRSNSRKK